MSRSGDIRDQSRRLYEIDRNFACLWPPIFFGGGGELHEFLESIYKIDTASDHEAKFRGDRRRELGDYALKKKKDHEQNRRPPVLPYGRPSLITQSVIDYFNIFNLCTHKVRKFTMKFSYLISGKSSKSFPPESDFKAKMHQIRFRLGIRRRPRWGSLQRSPRPPGPYWI